MTENWSDERKCKLLIKKYFSNRHGILKKVHIYNCITNESYYGIFHEPWEKIASK